MALHEGFLSYERGRWIKLSLALVALATLVYAIDDPIGGPSGNTVYGYTVGTLAAALMLWLTWFGARKRSYRAAGAPLRGWLSAHVYLGIAVVVLVPLHSGFQFHLNVHTLAYALMSLTVATGIAGVALYATLPTAMTANRSGEPLEGLLERISQLDAEARAAASALPDLVSQAVARAIGTPIMTGGLLSQLGSTDARCPTAAAVDVVAGILPTVADELRPDSERVLELLALRRTLVARIRREARMQTLLDLWLIAHIPLAVASVVAVIVHVIAVFYYR